MPGGLQHSWTDAATIADAVPVAVAAAVPDAMKYYTLAFYKEVYYQRVPQFVVTRGSLSVLTKYFRSWTEIILFRVVYRLSCGWYAWGIVYNADMAAG